MKKLLVTLFTLSVLVAYAVSVVGFANFPTPNPSATFTVMFAGSPDEYGNQILNATIDQEVGGVWDTRGIVTETNYTQDADLYGFVNQSTQFICVVALNYSWADDSAQAAARTTVYLTVGSEITSEPMTFYQADLITTSQGWVVEYRYTWDESGKPEATNYGVTFRYTATGSSGNYNLSHYDTVFGSWADGGSADANTNTTQNGMGLLFYLGAVDHEFYSRHTGLTIPITDDTTLKFSVYGYDDEYAFAVTLSVTGYVTVKAYATAPSSYTEYECDLSAYSGETLTVLQIWTRDPHNDGGSYLQLKYVYLEDYGSYNVSLDNTGCEFGSSDGDIATEYTGFVTLPNSNDHLSASGFQPLNGLGAVSIVDWIVVAELGSDYVYLNQYVDANNRIELGMDGVSDYYGNISFSIGNSTDSVTVEAPVVAITSSGTARTLLCVIATWEKGGTLKLRVNGTLYESTDTLTGSISAADDFYIGARDGVGDSPSWHYGVSLYYRVLTAKEQSNIYALGPETTMPYLYHHYSMDEALLGYGTGSAVAHDAVFSTSMRESWSIDYNVNTLAGFLAPNPLVYPEVYIWLGGWCLIPFGFWFGKSKGDENGPEKPMYWGIGVIIIILGFAIVAAGV